VTFYKKPLVEFGNRSGWSKFGTRKTSREGIIMGGIDKLETHQGAESTFWGIGLALASGIIMRILSQSKKKLFVHI
jgi:hypothetical protein